MHTFDRVQRRILGVLIEKKSTTPDIYPLTVPALLAGANQKSNRDPEMELAQWELEGPRMTGPMTSLNMLTIMARRAWGPRWIASVDRFPARPPSARHG